LYAGATILGGDTVVGHHSVVGGNVWLVRSVPPYSVVEHDAVVKVGSRDRGEAFDPVI
jgi:serine O-acetyltransferase